MPGRFNKLFGRDRQDTSLGEISHVEDSSDRWKVEAEYLPQLRSQSESYETGQSAEYQKQIKQEAVSDARKAVMEAFGDSASDYSDSSEQKSDSIADKMEKQHAVKDAPMFVDQVRDVTRTTPFVYFDRDPDSKEEFEKEATEHEGLQELDAFLATSLETGETDLMRAKAREIKDTLTFMGHEEYEEATKGLAEYWKSLLESEDTDQLCILTGLAAEKPGEIKSDDYLFESILQQFSDDELSCYRGKLVNSLEQVVSEKSKVVLLDDWIVTGQQMSMTSKKLLDQHPDLATKLEIHCITTSDRYIDEGLKVDESLATTIPVRAYYKAPTSRIAGAHSVPKQRFKYDLEMMLNANVPGRSKLPSLATIKKPYSAADYSPTRKHLLAK